MRVIHAGNDLELRPLSPEDACPLFAAVERNRCRLRRWLPWVTPDYSLEHIRRFIEEKRAENSAGASLTTGIWFDGKLSGAIGLHRINQMHRNTSIGYWIDDSCEGRGIVTQACRSMITEGFANYALHRIEIRCATGNGRSASVARRLGFVQEGILQEAEWLHDHWVDLYVFRMLVDDWNLQVTAY